MGSAFGLARNVFFFKKKNEAPHGLPNYTGMRACQACQNRRSACLFETVPPFFGHAEAPEQCGGMIFK